MASFNASHAIVMALDDSRNGASVRRDSVCFFGKAVMAVDHVMGKDGD